MLLYFPAVVVNGYLGEHLLVIMETVDIFHAVLHLGSLVFSKEGNETSVPSSTGRRKLQLLFNYFLRLDRLTPVSDQDRISPYYINTISCRQVMRIKKNINYGITN